MSEDKNQLVDYTNYDGDYQAGELLREDGEAIDLDELKNEEPTKIPAAVIVIGILFALGLIGIAYFVVVKTKPAEVQERVAPRKVDPIYEKALTRLSDTRNKEFAPLFKCWEDMTYSFEGSEKLTADSLKKSCPPIKAGNVSYEARCTQGCGNFELHKCEGGKCTKVDGLSYGDFVYGMLLRYSDGFNLAFAYQRLYDETNEKVKDMERGQQSTADGKAKPESAELKELKGKLDGFRKALEKEINEGTNVAGGSKSYFSEDASKVAEAAIAEAKAVLSAKAPAGGKSAGTFVVHAGWPVKAIKLAAYKPIGRYNRMDDKADRIGKLRYTNMTWRFFTSLKLMPELSECAEKAQGSETVMDLTMGIGTESGLPSKGSVRIKFKGEEQAALKKCVLDQLTRLEYRGISSKAKSQKVHFQLKFVR